MELVMRFFDKEGWSIYATINATIILSLFILTRQKLDLQTLVMISLIGMMSGDVLPRLIFTFFLSILTFEKSWHWVGKTVLYLISAYITTGVPYDNTVQKAVAESPILLWCFRIVIVLWFLYLGRLMMKK